MNLYPDCALKSPRNAARREGGYVYRTAVMDPFSSVVETICEFSKAQMACETPKEGDFEMGCSSRFEVLASVNFLTRFCVEDVIELFR